MKDESQQCTPESCFLTMAPGGDGKEEREVQPNCREREER